MALVNDAEELDDYPFRNSFFRAVWEDADHSGRDLWRSDFTPSGWTRVRFDKSRLSESYMCWVAVVGCDFSGADLSNCDMRVTVFRDCIFDGANLRGADLRRSSFEGCTFVGAQTAGATADDEALDYLFDLLTDEQRSSMELAAEQWPEPPGG